MSRDIFQHEGKKYLRTIYSATGVAAIKAGMPCLIVDVYDVLKAFNVTCAARQHAIKKLLCSGIRGKGGELDDLVGAEAAICRAIELEKEREKERMESAENQHN